MRLPGEANQGKGVDGIREAKEWLESTTRFEILWEAWAEGVTQLSLPQLNGAREGLDLRGMHYDPMRRPGAEVWVEVKNETTAKKLTAEYDDFLTTCYSAFTYWHRESDPTEREFIFLTWHPFGSSDEYQELTTAKRIKTAIDADAVRQAKKSNDPRVTEDDWDESLAKQLAKRLTLIILSRRLEDLQMSNYFLGLIKHHVTAKGHQDV